MVAVGEQVAVGKQVAGGEQVAVGVSARQRVTAVLRLGRKSESIGASAATPSSLQLRFWFDVSGWPGGGAA